MRTETGSQLLATGFVNLHRALDGYPAWCPRRIGDEIVDDARGVRIHPEVADVQPILAAGRSGLMGGNPFQPKTRVDPIVSVQSQFSWQSAFLVMPASVRHRVPNASQD